jgi:hypothetical protein
MMSWIDSWHRKISTGRHFQNGHHNAAQIPYSLISTSWIDSQSRKISTGLRFQNGHHNTAKIQHCSISKVAFDLFFKPVVSGQLGRLHNRYIIIISCFTLLLSLFDHKLLLYSILRCQNKYIFDIDWTICKILVTSVLLRYLLKSNVLYLVFFFY